MKQSIVLIILDGWGIGRKDESNPIYTVNPETFKFLEENYPMTSLQASGISVGLPWGETGNSEVGHLTIGAGKVLYQHYPRITLAIQDESFFENTVLKTAFAHARKNNSSVNLVGLLSKGNVHASLRHLQALIEMSNKEKVDVKLQLFSDGKDSAPFSLVNFIKEVPFEKLASLVGRYYAMDREQNWRLTQRAYDTMVSGGGQLIKDMDQLETVVKNHYESAGNEEFLPPLSFGNDRGIKDGDALIFFNYREDSIRQISEAFIVDGFSKFPVKKFNDLYLATMTQYEEKFNVPVVSPADTVEEPLGKILSENNLTQFRIAETYKYAHITYFFNGYQEPPFKGEYRVLVPSLNIPHINERPEMMAGAITDRLIQTLESKSFEFILANYANPDTIAHTGNLRAAVEAIKIIDKEIGRLVKAAIASGATLLITSDHGNVEQLFNPETGAQETQHDPNPVPFYLVDSKFKGRRFINYDDLSKTAGIISDVAPTILELMGIAKPKVMTGHSLLNELY